jgi:hypothetical protein
MQLLHWPLRALLALLLWLGAGGAWAQTLPLLTLDSFRWTEHDQGSTKMPVTLRLDAPNNERNVTGFITATQRANGGISPFKLATPGASCADGVDFVEIIDKAFTINRGELSTTVDVTICGDRVLEEEELFVVSVSRSTLVGARCLEISAGCATVPSIVNDDTGGSVVRIDDVRIQEPVSGTVEAVLTLKLSRRIPEDAVISWRTQSDTAVGGVAGALFSAGSCVGRQLFTGATVHRDFLPAGGTATIPANEFTAQVRVPICADGNATREAEKRFYVVLTTASGNLNGIADGRGQVDILANGPLPLGSAQLSTEPARVSAGVPQLLQLRWTMPPDQVWGDLRRLDLRIGADAHSALWVRWNALEDSFMLCRQAGSRIALEEDLDAHISGIPDNGCSAGALPGSRAVLETRGARLHLAGTRAVGSGPAGRTLTLNLALSFKPAAQGLHPIALSAVNAFGATQAFTLAGALHVLGADGQP